jgi:hypothetical protein
MHDILHVAIAKLLKDTPDVPVGTVTVDETVTLKVKATIKRNKDGEYTPTVSIPLKATLALLLAKMGFQRDRAAELLVEAMTEALNEDRLGEETISERLADIDTAMERVQAITAALPKETRKGAVTVKGSVEVVQPEPVPVLLDANELF